MEVTNLNFSSPFPCVDMSKKKSYLVNCSMIVIEFDDVVVKISTWKKVIMVYSLSCQKMLFSILFYDYYRIWWCSSEN